MDNFFVSSANRVIKLAEINVDVVGAEVQHLGYKI